MGQGHAVLRTAIDVQLTKTREACAAAHRSKSAQGSRGGLGTLWGRGSANGRQQVGKWAIVAEQEVQQCDPLWVDALHVEQCVDFLTQQVEGQARVLDRIVPGI